MGRTPSGAFSHQDFPQRGCSGGDEELLPGILFWVIVTQAHGPERIRRCPGNGESPGPLEWTETQFILFSLYERTFFSSFGVFSGFRVYAWLSDHPSSVYRDVTS